MSNSSKTVLAVDDDSYGLTFFKVSLARQGYHVYTASSAGEATALLSEHGLDSFHCVLTDFRMPRITGLDLLQWIHERDPHLSTIIVTAQDNTALVKDSLRGGAVDFLEKPVDFNRLLHSVEQGVQKTIRLRKEEQDQIGIRDIASIKGLFVSVSSRVSSRLLYYFRPLHELGGDFLQVMEDRCGKIFIILGDVSGHDVKAAFLSAYLQGVLRGIVEQGDCDIRKALSLCNDIVRKEWSVSNSRQGLSGEYISLSVIALEIDTRNATCRLINAGMPRVNLVDRHGFMSRIDYSDEPLGWNEKNPLKTTTLDIRDYHSIRLSTDGLIDSSESSGVDTFTYARMLLREETVSMLDDVMFLSFRFSDQMSVPSHQPLIYEQYRGDEIFDIDRLQDVWRRSLLVSFAELSEDRLYDFLLCCREAVINALVHGCDSSPEKVASFQVSISQDLKSLRVRIDDPGKGHSFDIEKRIQQLSENGSTHLGLGLIKNLSDNFATENNGTTLVFDFSLAK